MGGVGGAPVGGNEVLPDRSFRVIIPCRGARYLQGLTLLAWNEDIVTYKDIQCILYMNTVQARAYIKLWSKFFLKEDTVKVMWHTAEAISISMGRISL